MRCTLYKSTVLYSSTLVYTICRRVEYISGVPDRAEATGLQDTGAGAGADTGYSGYTDTDGYTGRVQEYRIQWIHR